MEIGSEATVDQRKRWDTAQASLYADLGQQLKALRANGKATATTSETPETPPPPEPPLPPAHYCQEHQTEYRRFEKDGRVWYSHRAGNQWCREK